MNYDFSTLSPSHFEDLARDLIGRELGIRFEAFAEGPDGGMDGRHAKAQGTTVLQAKHYRRSQFSTLKSRMGRELAAIGFIPQRYILATSYPLTPNLKDTLAKAIGPALVETGDIFGPEDLNGLLRRFRDIERAHQRLWGGSTTVLESVLTDVVHNAIGNTGAPVRQSREALVSETRRDVKAKVTGPHLALKYDPAIYVERAIEADLEKWLATNRAKTSTCFLILAPAGSGKTNLFCRIAERSSLSRPTVLLLGSQLLIDGNLGLWKQVLDACGISSRAEPSRRNCFEVVRDSVSTATSFAIILDAINEHPRPAELRRELPTFLSECDQAGIHVVVSCRDYYWGLFEAAWWSPFVRTHQDERKSTKRTLHNFTPEEATNAFEAYFKHFDVSAQPHGNALEQFRHPLLLRFFCETYRGERLGGLRDIRLKDLFDTYWDRKLSSIAERMIDQGTFSTARDLQRLIGDCILAIAGHMLTNNTRALSVSAAHKLTRSDSLPSDMPVPYVRILDEHIVLEELDAWGTADTTLVAFVFEEFMEYAMARSLFAQFGASDLEAIYADVIAITERYDAFSQVMGVVLYLALMLKERRGVALWPALMKQGPQWQNVIIEAFKKLPENQIDDGVFEALCDLLRMEDPAIRIGALELLKFGRLRRVPTPDLIAAVGELVTSGDLRIRRRALLALGSCPADFAIPLIEKGITTPIRKVTHAYEVARNAVASLIKLKTEKALPVIALIYGGFWHAEHIGAISAEYVLANMAGVKTLLHSDNVVHRLGAIRLLALVRTRANLSYLEGVVARLQVNPPSWTFDDLPHWARISNGYFIAALAGSGENLETAQAQSAVNSLKMEVASEERRQSVRDSFQELITDGDIDRIRDAIPDLSFAEDAVVKLLQAGLDKRDPGRWRVRATSRDIRIAPRKRAKLSPGSPEFGELAQLLALDEGQITEDGVFVSISGRSYDYWKEYLYRCWGLEPSIFGYFDHWD